MIEKLDKDVEEIAKAVETTVSETLGEKTISDVLDTVPFYPDIARIPMTDVEDVTLRLLDAKVIKDLEGDYGVHDLAMMLTEDLITHDYYVILCSGQVVLRKVKLVIDGKFMPILATLTRVKSKKPGHSSYWDMI